jgi:hypothetical protein
VRRIGNILYFDSITITPQTSDPDPMFIAGLDTSGNTLFVKTLSSGGDDQNAIGVGPSGNIYIGGDYISNPVFIIGKDTLTTVGYEDPFIAKLGFIGNFIEDPSPRNILTLYPNPFNNRINLSSSEFGTYVITLYDLRGRVVKKQTVQEDSSIYTEDISKGIYVLQVITDRGEMLNFKVEKQ